MVTYGIITSIPRPPSKGKQGMLSQDLTGGLLVLPDILTAGLFSLYSYI